MPWCFLTWVKSAKHNINKTMYKDILCYVWEPVCHKYLCLWEHGNWLMKIPQVLFGCV
jgi:hypothetical protein